jgi:biopolymer transport protein ExbD
MRISSLYPHKKARIEIIPLIDIMFFLLASFMMASLSMMRLQALKMNLPTATVARSNTKPIIVNLAVDSMGNITIDKKPYNYVEVKEYLANKYKTNSAIPVFITGSEDATHGMIIGVLDLVHSVGIQQVSFAISTPAK